MDVAAAKVTVSPRAGSAASTCRKRLQECLKRAERFTKAKNIDL